MDCLHIEGGVPLVGSVEVAGAKNAALPIMAASILASRPVRLVDVPELVDVRTLSLLLGHLGVEVKRGRGGDLHIQTVDPRPTRADYDLVRRMRASFCVLGPLLARRGRAAVALPGGCNLGARPVDVHLAGLAALGAEIGIERGYVVASARRLVGATIDLTGPRGPSVTGTANVLSAAVLARGRTVICHAAREPEIVDLGRFLNKLGARIEGLGGDTIEITGVAELGGAAHRIIPDRIEAATLLMAAVVTGGAVRVRGVRPDHMTAVLSALEAAGAEVHCSAGEIAVRSAGRRRPIDLAALPYPGVPTDLQAQFMALAAVADGPATIRDLVFPERFRHVEELNRLGARIERTPDGARVNGVARLSGAPVTASDLRASAALVLAALAAEGRSVVRRVHHLDRGYERLEVKLSGLGARIARGPGTAAGVPREPMTA
jgi:UDP-N-acetylglucosamine 1-carboxyvinyltransferase